jgi:hypothetical protein
MPFEYKTDHATLFSVNDVAKSRSSPAAQLVVSHSGFSSGQENTGYPKNMLPEQKHIHRKKIVGKKNFSWAAQDHRNNHFFSISSLRIYTARFRFGSSASRTVPVQHQPKYT